MKKSELRKLIKEEIKKIKLNEWGRNNKLNDKLFKELVPSSGKADTLEGEILRAYNRLAYRFYNDGDIYFMDYGEETCGSSYNFLKKHAQEIPGLKNELAKLRTTNEKKYEAVLENLGDIIIKFLYKKTQSKEELTPNTEDSR